MWISQIKQGKEICSWPLHGHDNTYMYSVYNFQVLFVAIKITKKKKMQQGMVLDRLAVK